MVDTSSRILLLRVDQYSVYHVSEYGDFVQREQ